MKIQAKEKLLLKKLEEAAVIAKLLKLNAMTNREFPMAETWAYIGAQIEQIISCDHDEAGLRPMLQKRSGK